MGLGRKLTAGAILLGIISTAHAEDEVRLYGRVVMGLDFQDNVAKPDGGTRNQWRMADNQWGTSMIGFKGTESLGADLKTVFQLESGFSAATGRTNGEALFNRRAYVGLQSKSFGTLLAGKNMAIADAIWALDPTGQQYIGSATLVRGRNWYGFDNMVSYETPNWGGFSTLLVTTLDEQEESPDIALRKDGVSIAYVRPSFELRAIYDDVKGKDKKYSNLFTASKLTTLGGTYTWRGLKLYAAFEYLSAPDAPNGTPDKAYHYWVGANYQATESLTLIGSAFRVILNKNGGYANLFMLGANYNLSKRTLLYVSVGYVSNNDVTNFSVEATNNNPPAGKGQTGGYTGIVHMF